MSATATPNHSDFADQLPQDAYHHLIHTLRLALPPPPADTAEDRARRDHSAIARIAALAPGNAAEADLAAQFVAASEQGNYCLRIGQLPETRPEWAAKCRAQASSMMRQANSALRLLLRVQDTRRKLEADNVARDRVAWTEHCAMRLMAHALSGTQPGVAEPHQPSEANLELGAPIRAGAEPAPEADPVAAAAEYAALYPDRAALICRLGRLPDDAPFGPPDDAVLQALIGARNGDLPPPDRAWPEIRAA